MDRPITSADAAGSGPISFRDEVARKGIHLASAGLPIFYWFTNFPIYLSVLLPLLTVSIVMEVLRHGHPGFRAWLGRWFGHLFRTEERVTLSGATWVLLANLAAVLLFRKDAAVAALLMLSISDAAASLIGRSVGGPALGGKSLSGSGAFFVTALAIVAAFMPGKFWAGAAGALAATLAEALPSRLGGVRIDDNLTIPLVAGAVLHWLG